MKNGKHRFMLVIRNTANHMDIDNNMNMNGYYLKLKQLVLVLLLGGVDAGIVHEPVVQELEVLEVRHHKRLVLGIVARLPGSCDRIPGKMDLEKKGHCQIKCN